MYLYLRLMPDEEPDDLARDLPQIKAAVAKIPGVSLDHKQPKPHPRGGYALFFECPEEVRLALAETLAAHGFRPCF